jgi:hypothetical protein
MGIWHYPDQITPRERLIEFGKKLMNLNGHQFSETYSGEAEMQWMCSNCYRYFSVSCIYFWRNETYLVRTFMDMQPLISYYTAHPIELPAIPSCNKLKMQRALK